MPRITTGTAKNKQIKIPDIPNIRVAQDKYKMALFAIVGDKVENANCLDLFAGSGSFGIEALSRGAKHCDFVDENKIAVQTLDKNLQNCKLTEKAEVHQDNSTKFAANTGDNYDLIFVDPFYNDLKHKFLLKNLEEILNDKGLIAFSHGKNLNIEEQIENIDLEIVTQRRFGKAYLTILKKN